MMRVNAISVVDRNFASIKFNVTIVSSIFPFSPKYLKFPTIAERSRILEYFKFSKVERNVVGGEFEPSDAIFDFPTLHGY